MRYQTHALTLCILFVAALHTEPALSSGVIGLYFDADANDVCAHGAPLTPVTLYVILLEPTFDRLYGWEAAVQVAEGNSFTLGTSVTSGGTDSDSGSAFRVEYVEPLVVGQKTVLATITIMPITRELCLILTGTSNPSLPVPGPLVWATSGEPEEIETANAIPNGVDAVMGDCIVVPGYPIQSCQWAVAAARQNWGTLKAWYR